MVTPGDMNSDKHERVTELYRPTGTRCFLIRFDVDGDAEVIMKTTILAIVFVALASTLSTLAHAEEHHASEGEHKNHLSLFLGNTHEEGEDEFTIGLDYERRLDEFWGIGGLVDHAGGEFDTTVLAVPLFFHPHKRWRLLLAPGVEIHNGDSEFLIRAGVGYEFEVNEWTVSPEFSVDRVDNEYIQVFGLSIGRGF